MPMISCEACNEQISSDSKACSKCGHPTKKSVAAIKKQEREAALKANPPGPIAYIASTAIILGVVYACTSGDDKTKERIFSAGDALVMCQMAMEAASKYPDKADIPYIGGVEGTNGFSFSWGSSTEHMMWMNGLGMMVPTSGSCFVSKDTKKVTGLTINGKTIF